MRPGVRLGVDVGRARVGIARTDAQPLMAVPVTTLRRSPGDVDGQEIVPAILQLVDEYEAIEVIVGLPLNLKGEPTPSTDDALRLASRLATASRVPVRVLDERLTTVSASASLRAVGMHAREQRSVIDQQAAVVLLQQALDIESRSHHAPGELVSPESQ